MPYREVTEKLAAYRREIAALRDKMRALQQQVEPEEVENYRFATSDGPVITATYCLPSTAKLIG